MSRTKVEQVMARDLADALRIVLSSLTLVEGVATAGNPYVTIGNVAIGGGGAYIDFMPESSVQQDSLGNSQRVYAPHKIRVAVETSGTANVAIMTSVVLSKLMALVVKHGAKVELWMEDNGTAPTVTTFDTPSSKLKAEIYPDLYNPLRSQM